MRSISFLICLLIIFNLSCKDSKQDNTFSQLEKQIEIHFNSLVEKQIQTIQSRLTEDYSFSIGVNLDQNVDKIEFLDDLKSGLLNFSSANPSHIFINTKKDTGVLVTCRLDLKATWNNIDCSGIYGVTMIWMESNKNWLLDLEHLSKTDIYEKLIK